MKEYVFIVVWLTLNFIFNLNLLNCDTKLKIDKNAGQMPHLLYISVLVAQ